MFTNGNICTKHQRSDLLHYARYCIFLLFSIINCLFINLYEQTSEQMYVILVIKYLCFYLCRYYELIPALQTILVFRGKFWRGDVQTWHLAVSS